MPAIARWSRSSGCRWRGWSISSAKAVERRRPARPPAPGWRPSRRSRPRRLGSSFAQAALPGAELAQPQLAPVRRARIRMPRARGRAATRACRTSAAGPPTSGGPAATGRRRLDDAASCPSADAGDLAPVERRQRRVEGLHRVHAGCECRFDSAPSSAAPRRRAVISTSDSSACHQVSLVNVSRHRAANITPTGRAHRGAAPRLLEPVVTPDLSAERSAS